MGEKKRRCCYKLWPKHLNATHHTASDGRAWQEGKSRGERGDGASDNVHHPFVSAAGRALPSRIVGWFSILDSGWLACSLARSLRRPPTGVTVMTGTGLMDYLCNRKNGQSIKRNIYWYQLLFENAMRREKREEGEEKLINSWSYYIGTQNQLYLTSQLILY